MPCCCRSCSWKARLSGLAADARYCYRVLLGRAGLDLFAVLHFPFWSDNATESSDTWLQGPDRLEGLLGRYGVDLVFNGHAHIYQRNLRRGAGGFVSYVTGGGGAKPEPIGGRGCDALDFLLVIVDPTQVTVTPTDSLGRTFDVQRYDLRGACRSGVTWETPAHTGRVLESRREQGMDTPDERAATAAAGSRRGPLLRRPEVERWAHHVADLNSGEVHTDVLDAPPTSTSRVEGLSRLGPVGGTTVFNGPSFVLTSKIPFVASPEFWFTALIDYFNPFVGMQWTSPPSPQNPRNLLCYFSQLPAERSLLTISVVASATTTVGHVSVGWVPHMAGGLPANDHKVRYPIQGADTDYTLDFTFERGGMAPPDFVMTLEPGIEWMQFNSVTLQTAPLVVFPGVF